MIIRTATIEDLEGICEVAAAVKLNYDTPQKGGFLVYGLTKMGYAHRIKSSPFFYVALSDDKVVGFLMCYDNETLTRLIRSGVLNHEDNLTQIVSERQGNYIFGDQIGVVPDKTVIGIGTSLMERLFGDIQRADIDMMYIGILHEPVMNIASKTFCEKLGFIHQENVTNSDNHIWGIYRLALSGSSDE